MRPAGYYEFHPLTCCSHSLNVSLVLIDGKFQPASKELLAVHMNAVNVHFYYLVVCVSCYWMIG